MKKSYIITFITALLLLQSCSTEDINTLLEIKDKYQEIKPKYDKLKEDYGNLVNKYESLQRGYDGQQEKLVSYMTAGKRLYD